TACLLRQQPIDNHFCLRQFFNPLLKSCQDRSPQFSKMSVDELRARIAAIGSEIEVQKKLLKKLETDRSLVQCQLNAALDPVARLPLEISSEIFLHSLAASHTGKQDVPTVLLRICHNWTDIALSRPRLWTSIRIQFPCGEDFAEVLRIWFQRARNLPLSVSISIRGPTTNWNHRISDVLWTHGGQLKHFEILSMDKDQDQSDELETPDTVDLFGDTTPLSLPLLETISIHCQHQPQGGWRGCFGSQIFDLLRGAPNIAEVVFGDGTDLDDEPDIIVVPTLHRLVFGEAAYSDDEILCYLALPALESLSLPMCYVSGDELVAWVKRSAAPLCDLALGWQYRGRLNSFQLHECLRLMPTLGRFRMWRPDSDVVTELFAALADTPSLLPNLHDLSINLTGTLRHISDSSWRNFVRALSSHRLDQLYIVPVMSPPTDVLDSLRELASQGAKMHIGTEELNYVAA
ncbi:hypothetical protein C8R45DRAFT_363629, partial [Mycena sanguinolenta]